MRASLLMFVVVSACAPESSKERGELRQPLPIVPAFPTAMGRTPGARLGSSLGLCRGAGYVAGAPGDNSTFLFSSAGTTWLEPPLLNQDAGAFAVAVACDGPPTALRVLTAGDLGAWWSSVLGSATMIDDAATETLERGPLTSSPLLLGSPETGTVGLQASNATGFTWLTDLAAYPTAGTALVWDRLGTYFAVGNPAAATVKFYGWTVANGVTPGPVMISGPANSGFGAALATGDVHPHPGAELLIGAPGSAQVFIYGAGMGAPLLLMVLDAANPVSGSFGLSLAVEPNALAGGLSAFWVGDPLNEQLVRFLGDAGQPLAGVSAGSHFGFSLAATEQNLIVGAPLYSDVYPETGAIFSVPFDVTIITGMAMKCDVRTSCPTPSCQVGKCLGGVVCQPTGAPQCDANSCAAGFCVNVDAGVGDGGLNLDAGTMNDGGVRDAGEVDGGAPDAGSPDAGEGADGGTSADGGVGVQTFGTCGCSGLGAVPLVLMSMWLGRRRRR